MGTHVVSGSAHALVVRTGIGTEFGSISEHLRVKPETTEFERGVRRLISSQAPSPLRVEYPVTVGVDFNQSEMADRASLFPGARRRGQRAWEGENQDRHPARQHFAHQDLPHAGPPICYALRGR